MQEATMTLREATALAALYRRERDAEYKAYLALVSKVLKPVEAECARILMQRPGIQNGLKGLEEMEAVCKR